MKDKIKVITDWCTIICPLILTIGGTLEASGIIDMLGSAGGVVVAVLAGVTTVASIVYNIVTGVYKKGR